MATNGKSSQSGRIIKSLKAKADTKRTISEKIADAMTAAFGNITFLVINAAVFLFWIIINTGMIPTVKPFDPFPFGLLTTMVSLEAIFLAIFVLISQNRAAQVDDLREEIDLQVDMITEEELTKLMHMVAQLMEKKGIDVSKDSVLQNMLQPTNITKIEKALERDFD